MTVLPEHFDQEKYWLLATRSKRVQSVGIPALTTMEYEYVWCTLDHERILWGGRTLGQYGGDQWPGGSWCFGEFLQLLSSPETTRGGSEASIVFRVWNRMKLEWFRPILEKLAAGKTVSYAEANEAHSVAHAGKPLRLYPRLASVDAINNWEKELNYEY